MSARNVGAEQVGFCLLDEGRGANAETGANAGKGANAGAIGSFGAYAGAYAQMFSGAIGKASSVDVAGDATVSFDADARTIALARAARAARDAGAANAAAAARDANAANAADAARDSNASGAASGAAANAGGNPQPGGGFCDLGKLPRLEMAGGEFCGNAARCFAAWLALTGYRPSGGALRQFRRSADNMAGQSRPGADGAPPRQAGGSDPQDAGVGGSERRMADGGDERRQAIGRGAERRQAGGGGAAPNYAGGRGAASRAAQKIGIEVSGSREPLIARINGFSPTQGRCGVTIEMPLPEKLAHGASKALGKYSVVGFSGISHLILWERPPSAAWQTVAKYSLDPALSLLRNHHLPTDCYGVLFCDMERRRMTPLVSVEAIGSMVWEGSCGSGTIAVASALACQFQGSMKNLAIEQPGGRLVADVIWRQGGLSAAYLSGDIGVVATGTLFVELPA
ncbi:MAG: hypothetical protein LBJ10_04300 [Clostridiales bacterium]|nr:hypothetical protein [Clostridiales bacterium]